MSETGFQVVTLMLLSNLGNLTVYYVISTFKQAVLKAGSPAGDCIQRSARKQPNNNNDSFSAKDALAAALLSESFSARSVCHFSYSHTDVFQQHRYRPCSLTSADCCVPPFVFQSETLVLLDSNCSVKFEKVRLLTLPESAVLTPALWIIFDPVFKTL